MVFVVVAHGVDTNRCVLESGDALRFRETIYSCTPSEFNAGDATGTCMS